MSKKSVIIIVLAILLIGGVLYVIKSFRKQPNLEQTGVNTENIQDPVSASVTEKQPKTLDDLLAQAEEIQLPKVDTTGWRAYRDEKLGVEFMYPKGWSVSAKEISHFCIVKGVYTNKSVCFLEFEFLQGKSADDVEKYLISMCLSAKMERSSTSCGKTFSDNLPQKAYFVVREGGRDRFSIKDNNFLMTLYVATQDNEGIHIGDVIDTSYGILQTLKPLQK
jgi:hypothetical protein